MAENKSMHRMEKRICPICKESKEYPARQATCSQDCAWKLATESKRKSSAARVVEMPKRDPIAEHKAKREAADVRAELREAVERAEATAKLNELVEGLMGRPAPEPPAWTRTAKSGSKQATPTAFLSDAHFDEVVHPEQVEGLNGYDRQIAEDRLKRFFENTAVIAKDYLRGLNYPGIVVPMGGDMFSGDIHEELKETNESTIQESLYHWLDPMMAGLKFLADEFGKVYVPTVVGNHPRGTKKPSHKMRVPNNFDWLFAVLLEKFLASDKRITFGVSKSADIGYNVYETRYRLSHGDQFRGGSGIAGFMSPLMIGDARKRKRSQATGADYDYLLLGHWHQRAAFKKIITNGSIKGYDEYAYHSNFEFEEPQQSFWLTDPKHGVTISAPIHVKGKREKWMSQAASIYQFGKAA